MFKLYENGNSREGLKRSYKIRNAFNAGLPNQMTLSNECAFKSASRFAEFIRHTEPSPEPAWFGPAFVVTGCRKIAVGRDQSGQPR